MSILNPLQSITVPTPNSLPFPIDHQSLLTTHLYVLKLLLVHGFQVKAQRCDWYKRPYPEIALQFEGNSLLDPPLYLSLFPYCAELIDYFFSRFTRIIAFVHDYLEKIMLSNT